MILRTVPPHRHLRPLAKHSVMKTAHCTFRMKTTNYYDFLGSTVSSLSSNANISDEDSWVLGSDVDGAAHFLLDMHPDLGDPIEQLGMEIVQDDNDTVTDFKQRFGEKLLWDSGVNVTALEEEDLRCGGLVTQSNMSGTYNMRLSEWAADCMVQQCQFRQGGPEICPPDYRESDDKVFWIYFGLRFLATTML